MKLSQLLASLTGVSTVRGSDAEILSITDDSRRALPGSLFIARKGASADGAAFIDDAMARGAVAAVEASAAEAAAIAHAFHGHPAHLLRMVGVTGTNGKTTTAFLIQHILRESGIRAGLLGTVLTDDGERREPAALTTPGACELAGVLARMVSNGCQAVAMEVSSHALDQGRVAGIGFEVAVFTNLTGDHLDYHGSMDAYAGAKASLFESLSSGGCAVVNIDDPSAGRMLAKCRARVLRCSANGADAECRVCVLRTSIGSMKVELSGPWGAFAVTLGFVGAHNAMNTLQAAAAAWSLGVSVGEMQRALGCASAPPGRLEPVTAPDAPFSVLVDYAHTDDALLNVLSAVRAVVGSGRIITLFGCGGDRDRSKRPRMMRIAAERSEIVIVTSDNPRTEDPNAILSEILAGAPEACSARIEAEVDRALAIRRAVSLARPGDIVLIAGKGHEDYQIIGRQKRSFDDRIHAREALAALQTKSALQGVSA
jgi:UDP-N-acetylmuramoyl-L-alanyl-D-glutamate--2,6-diaminopimelate ligase